MNFYFFKLNLRAHRGLSQLCLTLGLSHGWGNKILHDLILKRAF